MNQITFTTTLDRYKGDIFPSQLSDIPRVGDFVQIRQECLNSFKKNGLFIELQVKKVTWKESNGNSVVEIDLHYSEMQAKILQQEAVHPYKGITEKM